MAEEPKAPVEEVPELTREEEESVTHAEKLQGADPNAVSGTVKKLLARAHRERELRAKADAENKTLQEKLAALEKPVAPAAAPAPSDELPIREVLGLRAEGYSEKEILELVDEAASLGIPVKKILQNPTFKQGLEVKRTKAKAEQNTPSPTFGGRQRIGEKELSGEALARHRFQEMTQGERRDVF